MIDLVQDVEELLGFAHGDSAPVFCTAEISAALRRHLPKNHAVAFGEIARGGLDSTNAEQLLSRSKKLGAATLGTITKQALTRFYRSGKKWVPPRTLFNLDDRRKLTKAFAATTATAELFGRARVRRRQEEARRRHEHAEKFGEYAPLDAYKIRKINATEFRGRGRDTQEFGLWASAYDFPEVIPPGEVWIDDAVDDVDTKYFLFNAEAVRRARQQGLEQDDADDFGLAAERAERERQRLGGEGVRPYHAEIPKDVYVRHWKTLSADGETVQVFIVKGRIIRERFKTDWFAGGHAYVYPWQPENEIWIEYHLRPEEQQATLIHEATERSLMKHEQQGYDDAHEIASKKEFAFRQRHRRHDSFSEEPTNFDCFDEALRPMGPQRAIEYFKRLVPKLSVDPIPFGQAHERNAFTLAAATEQELLEKIQGIIGNRLESGRFKGGPQDIDQVLYEVGVHPKNPQYGEMVFRTNMMDSYRTGGIKELQDPDVVEDFPVWRYVGVRDGRQGEDHEVHFNKYFDSKTSFNAVRDQFVVKDGKVVPSGGRGRPYNCRCDFIPIYKTEWAKLKAGGATIERMAA